MATDVDESSEGAPPGGIDTEPVDPRRLRVHRPAAPRDVPYVPTDEAVVPAILRLAGVGADDVVYDLGCGDGRILIAAARHYGARGVGIDIDPLRIRECHDNARRLGVRERVRFLQASLFDVDLGPASVVTLYLLPSLNIRLRPKLLGELRPGARVVSNHFEMPGWHPDESVYAHRRNLYKWIIPARVEGEWHCTVNDPAGRRHLRLALERRFQILTGKAHVAGRDALIGLGRVQGDTISFRLVEWGREGAVMRYSARIEGKHLRGRCWQEGREETAIAWGGSRG
jgi:SAM-dependent methyltransferase